MSGKPRYYTRRSHLYFNGGWGVYDRTTSKYAERQKPIGLFFTRGKARKVAKLLNEDLLKMPKNWEVEIPEPISTGPSREIPVGFAE